jgi:histidine ammonia-lyase
MPASVFSRSTECHNQDKVSLGTIAARDCLRVMELTEQVAVATLLAALQGLELRMRNGELKIESLPQGVVEILNSVRSRAAFVEEDRPLESDLRWLLEQNLNQTWKCYE